VEKMEYKKIIEKNNYENNRQDNKENVSEMNRQDSPQPKTEDIMKDKDTLKDKDRDVANNNDQKQTLNSAINMSELIKIEKNKISAYKRMLKSRKFITRISALQILRKKTEYAKILMNEIINVMDDEHSTVRQLAEKIVRENATENDIETLKIKKEMEPRLTGVIEEIIRKLKKDK
jgi:hypothetical protein